MARCLFVGKSELDEIAVVIGPSDKAKTGREIVTGESRGHDDRRNENKECIEMKRAFLIDKGRVDAVADQRGLVLDGLVHDGVQLVIRHDFKKMGHQLILRPQALIMFACIGISLEALSRAFDHFGEVG